MLFSALLFFSSIFCLRQNKIMFCLSLSKGAQICKSSFSKIGPYLNLIPYESISLLDFLPKTEYLFEISKLNLANSTFQSHSCLQLTFSCVLDYHVLPRILAFHQLFNELLRKETLRLLNILHRQNFPHLDGLAFILLKHAETKKHFLVYLECGICVSQHV